MGEGLTCRNKVARRGSCVEIRTGQGYTWPVNIYRCRNGRRWVKCKKPLLSGRAGTWFRSFILKKFRRRVRKCHSANFTRVRICVYRVYTYPYVYSIIYVVHTVGTGNWSPVWYSRYTSHRVEQIYFRNSFNIDSSKLNWY